MFDTNTEIFSESNECPSDYLRRGMRSFSAMVSVPFNFVPILRPKKNEEDMSPLHLRDTEAELDRYLSDGKKNKTNKKSKTIVLHNASTNTSSSSNKDTPLGKDTVLENENYHVLPKKRKSVSILTLLQKK